MKELVRVEMRISPAAKMRLKSEAALLGLSLNQYLILILRFRKHARRAFTEQEIVANGD
jgi:hypothetical protein